MTNFGAARNKGTAPVQSRFLLRMKKRNSTILPVMGVLTVIAGAVGLQLGESAIAQIDPIHFSGPRPVPRDVTRDPRTPLAATYASVYGWAEGYESRARDCGDCPALSARMAYAAEPEPEPAAAPEPRRELWRDPVSFERAEYEEAPDTREWRKISRYVNYPVTQDQAALAESLGADAMASAPREEPREPEPAGL